MHEWLEKTLMQEKDVGFYQIHDCDIACDKAVILDESSICLSDCLFLKYKEFVRFLSNEKVVHYNIFNLGLVQRCASRRRKIGILLYATAKHSFWND